MRTAAAAYRTRNHLSSTSYSQFLASRHIVKNKANTKAPVRVPVKRRKYREHTQKKMPHSNIPFEKKMRIVRQREYLLRQTDAGQGIRGCYLTKGGDLYCTECWRYRASFIKHSLAAMKTRAPFDHNLICSAGFLARCFFLHQQGSRLICRNYVTLRTAFTPLAKHNAVFYACLEKPIVLV